MERFYKTASSLAEESQELASELFKHNPSFEGNNGKKSLATLAGMARELQYKYEDLTSDLIRKHERNQRNGFSSNS